MADTLWQDFPDSAPQAADIFLAMRGAGGVNFTATQLAALITSIAGISYDGSGRIGIGTTSPSARLHVAEGSSLPSISAGTSAIFGRTSGSSAFANVSIIAGNASASTLNFGDTDAENVGYIQYNHADNYLRFIVSNGERARFNSNGDLGVGTTNPNQGRIHAAVASDGDSGVAVTTPTGAVAILKADNVLGAQVRFGGTGGGANTLRFVGPGEVEHFRVNNNQIRPGSDNTSDLGTPALRYKLAYVVSGAINTSDARAKTETLPVPDEWLDAWGDVEWIRFKFKDAVEEKGEGARWHIGLIAQRVRDAFAAHDLDAQAIGLLCYDEWEEELEPIRKERIRFEARQVGEEPTGVLGPGGQPIMRPIMQDFEVPEMVDTGETRVTLEAGDRWGLRYDECQAMEAAWQRRELARKDALIADLADRLARLEAA